MMLNCDDCDFRCFSCYSMTLFGFPVVFVDSFAVVAADLNVMFILGGWFGS